MFFHKNHKKRHQQNRLYQSLVQLKLHQVVPKTLTLMVEKNVKHVEKESELFQKILIMVNVKRVNEHVKIKIKIKIPK